MVKVLEVSPALRRSQELLGAGAIGTTTEANAELLVATTRVLQVADSDG